MFTPCFIHHDVWMVVWLGGNALVSINEVSLCRAQLVLGWVSKPSHYVTTTESTQPSTLCGTVK